MNKIRHTIKLVMLVSLTLLIVSGTSCFDNNTQATYADDSPQATYFDDNAPPSFADQIRFTRSNYPMSLNWLADLTGLPDRYQVALLTQHVMQVLMESQDLRCSSISLNLRLMMFQHFVIYQHMANAQGIYFNDQTAYRWAHVLGMILKESGGDSASITDMGGYSITTDDSKTNLQQWAQIFKLSTKSRVRLDYQTNFGLTQTSADRLMDAFRLTRAQRYETSFLEGQEGASTPKKPVLNTATAIRRLIWFYQGFAQGRLLEFQTPLAQDEINNPQFSARYKKGLNMALLYCGTQLMFPKVPQQPGEKPLQTLQNAMASIAYCKLGNQQSIYEGNLIDEQCFAEWVTLCPALNVDIATLTPLSYFATRAQKPICEAIFKQLIIKKPIIERLLPYPQFF